ncbi:DNA-binding response regulator, NarL/FixJ family, contains REC and HTH domains [Algoriella xinjiangensis]|uniref:DNA-binding response regulator, NarL/FixJ family, contains REC and HTH domains n=1 Tax=Algoriella xinjiangensis TaxID=684065 RepID=A0A1I4SQE5_9FLAO|nr:response regulator transcription factor [Algoriella xinjiangensis]SFM66607.1 DNA-binding response regulator, NarL/FixJ family, contains REC and HTH domains [Algoriella xinjiangensis]VDH16235.1 Transcriptional regulatory protein uhpA [Algoriella xinjiangensis]
MKTEIKIALVDDHQIFLEGLKNLLQQENDFKIVYTANKAIDFIKSIDNLIIDILIVDVSMPDMNGLELINEIKKKQFSGRIIVLSSYANNIDDKLVDAAVLKEVSNKELIAVVRAVFKGTYKKENDHKTTKIINPALLSSREKEIVNLIADGLTVIEIAEKIALSKYTVETHKKNIFLKLNVTNNAELIKKAIILGQIQF